MSDIAEAAPDAPQETGTAAPGEIGTSTSVTDTAQPADAGISDSNTAPGQAEVPNVVPAAVESITAPASAPSAAGGDTTLLTAASSGERLNGGPGAMGSNVAEPLHLRIAVHLEAIYQMVREHTDALSKLV